MAKVAFVTEEGKPARAVINVESVGLTPEQCDSNALYTLPNGANGGQLGFLVYLRKRQVWIYRPNQESQQLDNPAVVSGDPELPGFALDLTEIWQ
jgi:Uma2 family endonuclease